MDELLGDMEDKGLAATASSWLKRAIKQKHPRVSIRLAASFILTYDAIDKRLIRMTRVN